MVYPFPRMPQKRSGAVASQFIGVTTAAITSIGFTLDVPTGAQTGDLLVTVIGVITNGAAITPPAGWTLQSSWTGGSTVSFFVYTHTVAGGDTSPWSWSTTSANHAVGATLCYRHATETSPVAGTIDHGNTNPMPIAGITQSWAGVRLVPIMTNQGSDPTVPPTSPLSFVAKQYNSGGYMFLYHDIASPAATYADDSITFPGSAIYASEMLAFQSG